ncbi:MAG: oligosaccharide flippase family protein [Firmicutes bacterium]|nr:oligosaccharide flippase family protein [Bacillota bacterium]MCL5038420.1 oligosaccharide flippase family protein [Bacillota bacterium]
MKAGRSLLFSASLLTLANLIGRSLGLVYRAFLSRYLGAEGMGLYQTMTAFCYSLVNPASAGLTVGVSQVIASKDPVSHSRMAAENGLLKLGFRLAAFFSVLAVGVTLPLARVLGPPTLPVSLLSLKLFWPVLVLPVFSSVWRGYFLGKNHVLPVVVSQVSQQIARLVWLSGPVLLLLVGGLTSLPRAVLNLERNSLSDLAGRIQWVVAGLLVSEAVGILVLIMWSRQGKARQTGDERGEAKVESRSGYTSGGEVKVRRGGEIGRAGKKGEAGPRKRPARDLVGLSFSVVGGRLVSSGLRLAEVSLIPARLITCGQDSSQALATYGLIYGIAMPLVAFPGVFTGSLATTLVPGISRVQGRPALVRSRIKKSLFATAVVGTLAATTFHFAGGLLADLVFGRPEAGGVVSALALLPLFLYLDQTSGAILRGLGRGSIPILANLTEAGVRLSFLFFGLVGSAKGTEVIVRAILAGEALSSFITLFAILRVFSRQ